LFVCVYNIASTKCIALNCEHKCVPSLEGGSCTCQEGYKVYTNDSRSCIDKDECSEWGYCSQNCENSKGSFKCSCVKGYKLEKDGKICTAEEQAVLYFVHHQNIFRLHPSSNDKKELLLNTTSGSGLDFHFQRKLLFWSDLETRKIYSIKIQENSANFENSKTITEISVPATSWSPVSIAVDWIGDKLYAADSIGQKIDVFELDGRNHAIVLSHNLTNPSDIALDPLLGLMFIADNMRVVRATMSGLKVKAIVTEAVYRASGLTLDLVTKRVFWCDSLLDYIETVDYNGLNRHFVVRGN
jgi:low density lipoprotein-related protein 2